MGKIKMSAEAFVYLARRGVLVDTKLAYWLGYADAKKQFAPKLNEDSK